MTDTVNKQKLLDYLNYTANDLYERGGIVPSGVLVILRDEIESGTFDSPSTPVQGYREALEEVREELEFWLEQGVGVSGAIAIIDQALSQTDIQPINSTEDDHPSTEEEETE